MKSTFAGFLRKLLHRVEEKDAVKRPAPRPVATTKTLVMPPPIMPPTAARPQTPQTKPAQTNFTPPSRPANPGELQLPLQPILDALPMELRSRVKRTDTANMVVSLPLEKILTQLALGTVRITFGELRLAAPGVFSDTSNAHDQKPVALPLNEIIARLSPSLLSRRIAQKHIEVSDDIASPFAGQGQGLKISPPPARPVTAAGIPPSRMITPVPTAAARVQPPQFPARSITPATPAVNGNGNNGSNGGGFRNITPIAAEPPNTPIASAPISPISPDAPAAKIPMPEQPSLSVPLSALLGGWPEALKLEIVQVNLTSAQVALPLDVVGAALKRGRVVFSWRNLRALIKPTPPAVSAHDGVELELPLHVIAPLFLAHQRGAAKSPQKIANVENIPDLFFGVGSPASQSEATPPAPIAPPPQSISPAAPIIPMPISPVTPVAPIVQPPQTISPIEPPPAPPSAPIPFTPPVAPIPVLPVSNPPVPVAKLPETNFFQRNDVPHVSDTEFRRQPLPGTDFLSRGATPKEIVERAILLEGVAGAIVALPDGLKVADKIPQGLNADTLAAFLPQLYGRVNQCAKELRMGELNNLNFTVGNVPWKIFRVNAVYFAAFGRAGQALPTAQLAMLATELDRKRL